MQKLIKKERRKAFELVCNQYDTEAGWFERRMSTTLGFLLRAENVNERRYEGNGDEVKKDGVKRNEIKPEAK